MENLTIAQRATLEASAVESNTSAVSWAAILAGAVVAAATSLVLALVVAGVDFASVSPLPGRGASARSITAVSAIALIIIQWLSAAIGGYLTGRLRTKWTATHTHEVFFRDTANGLIAWALATLLVAVTLASGASSLLGTGARAAGTTAATVASPAGGPNSTFSAYALDTLFRTAPHAEPKAAAGGVREETSHILAEGLARGEVSTADRSYLAQLVAAQTGVSDADAQRRVDDVINQLRADADAARRASEMAAIFAALSMLVGAVIAAVSAALGGGLRDQHP
jgi:hypothetical protein